MVVRQVIDNQSIVYRQFIDNVLVFSRSLLITDICTLNLTAHLVSVSTAYRLYFDKLSISC